MGGRKATPIRGKLERVKGLSAVGTVRLKIKITDGPGSMIDKHVYVELTADDVEKLAATLATENLWLKGDVDF